MSKNLGLRKNRGLSKTPTYRVWNDMMQRCYNPAQDSFRLYGGRGIGVCERWHDYLNFLADMGEKPEGFSLERSEVNGHYEPGNCTWIPLARQQHNKRTSRFLTHDGLTMTLADWGAKTGLGVPTIHARLKSGWAVERALTTPKGPQSIRYNSSYQASEGA